MGILIDKSGEQEYGFEYSGLYMNIYTYSYNVKTKTIYATYGEWLNREKYLSGSMPINIGDSFVITNVEDLNNNILQEIYRQLKLLPELSSYNMTDVYET